LTRRDLIIVASVIRKSSLSTVGRRRLALAMADQLARHNPGFDRKNFLAYALDSNK
jgi:hypothetical protein